MYGDKLILKLFRRLGLGVNPDLAIGRFLSQREFPNVPALAGAIEDCGERDERFSLAVLSGYAAQGGDAWAAALDALGRFYVRADTLNAQGNRPPVLDADLLRLSSAEIPRAVQELIGTYLVVSATEPKEIRVTFSAPRKEFDFLDAGDIKVVLQLWNVRKGRRVFRITSTEVSYPGKLNLEDIEPRQVTLDINERPPAAAKPEP